MPALRTNYIVEIGLLAKLTKRAERDKDRPEAWRQSVVQASQALTRLLLAADHDPSFEAAQKARSK